MMINCFLGQVRLKQAFLLLLVFNITFFGFYTPSASWLRGSEERETWNEFAEDYQMRFHRSPPKGLESWLDYAQKHQCNTRHHYESMDQDLEFFRQQTGHLDMDRVIPEGKKVTEFYIAISLKDHKLTMEDYHGKGWGFQWSPIQWWNTKRLFRGLLEPLRRHKPPLNTKFIVNLHDKARDASVNATYPLLSYCKEDYYTDDKPTDGSKPLSAAIHRGKNPQDFVASRDILFPARSSLQFERQDFWFWPFYSRGKPFSKRLDAINWRGSTTGDWETGPRFRLIREDGGTDVHPMQFPNGTLTGVDADFAFARTVQKPIDADSTGYRFTKPLKYLDLQRYKYILDVDGNGFTGRFPGLLRSGSLIFKSSHYREWFHGVLEPYKHYIPVNYDLSDLAEKVAWANANPDVAERIVEEGHKRVATRLRRQDIMCYTYRLILEYQILFQPQQ